MKLVIFTDGACSGNPGPGGWAWGAEDKSLYVSGYAPSEVAGVKTTNQRMELMAVLQALRAYADGERAQVPIEIVSDSAYVVNCFVSDPPWWKKWLSNNWKNAARKPIENRDLWEPLVDLYRSRGNITFRKVKGHSGNAMNDFVDKLAVEAVRTGRGVVHDPPF